MSYTAIGIAPRRRDRTLPAVGCCSSRAISPVTFRPEQLVVVSRASAPSHHWQPPSL